jgi:hypothetical protein
MVGAHAKGSKVIGYGNQLGYFVVVGEEWGIA